VVNKKARPPRKTESRFFFGYVVVIASFFIMVISWGLYSTFGVFLKPLLDEFGWTTAMTSGAFSLSVIVNGVLGIVMGGLTDRFGPRVVVSLCGLCIGVGFMLMSQVNAPWQLYLFYGVIIGIGMGGVWVPLLSSVARWFVGRRSLMTGIVISGLSAGQLVGPPVASRLIAAYDWRLSFTILGGVVLVFMVLAAQFLRRDPARMGQLPYGENEEEPRGLESGTNDFSFREAVNTAQFWVFLIMLFCFGFAAFSITVHIVPHAIELEIPAISAANILAILGGVGILGNSLLGGITGDRIGNRKAFIIGCVLMVVSLFWLLPAKEVWMFYLFAVAFGFALGGMGTSESPLVARLFGLSSHGLILAFIGLGFTSGAAIGPVVTGYIFDLNGSYQVAFLVCAVLSVAGLILAAMLRPTRRLGGRI